MKSGLRCHFESVTGPKTNFEHFLESKTKPKLFFKPKRKPMFSILNHHQSKAGTGKTLVYVAAAMHVVDVEKEGGGPQVSGI